MLRERTAVSSFGQGTNKSSIYPTPVTASSSGAHASQSSYPSAVKLVGNLYVVAGEKLTHPWDANAYLIAGAEPVLIDCGSSLGYPALLRNLAEVGYGPQDIRRVLATHGHWDHLSAMAQLRTDGQAQLWVHEGDREAVETGNWERTAAFLYDCPFAPAKVDGALKDGDVIQAGDYEMRVFHTPGHSPGSVCFWIEIGGIKLLIAGDTIFGGYHPKIQSDIDAWTASLDRLLELDFDAVTIGHSTPTLMFDAKTRVREARQRLGSYFDPWFKPFHLDFRY